MTADQELLDGVLKRTGFSLRQLSFRLGCDDRQVRRWKSGRLRIPAKYRPQLEEILDAQPVEG